MKTIEPTWYKAIVTFKNTRECREHAMPLALKLRGHYPFVYFARYGSSEGVHADFYFRTDPKLNSPKPALDLLKLRGTKLVLVKDPVSGSEAHAAGFDAVVRIQSALVDRAPDQHQRQCGDVIHWMYNMLGFDYLAEGMSNLNSLYNVLRVYQIAVDEAEKKQLKEFEQKAAKSARNFKKNIKAGRRCKRCGNQPGFCICEK